MLFKINVSISTLSGEPQIDSLVTDIKGLNTLIKLVSKIASYEISSVEVLSDDERNVYIESLQPNYATD